MTKNRTYVCIDLKSFYASVECIERGLDPITTNLVVADSGRTEKTICLAVTPTLKAIGIPGRARLFEVIQKVNEENRFRKSKIPSGRFSGKSCDANELRADPFLELDFIIAPPRMAHYIECSTQIYEVYLKYIAPEDIHVYSIDEVFMDVTDYLNTYKTEPRDLVKNILADILRTTGITATAGIGTNMYLAKVAMDIVAKHIAPDEDGVRIAELDEQTYRRQLWSHRPLMDFWRVGRGYAKKLEANRLYTMGDIAKFSMTDYGEDKLFKMFGINAELLIDHAWGYEPCTMADVKAYKPRNKSIGTGQVLHCPYTAEKARLIVREMVELMALDLVEKRLVTDQIVLTVGYDISNLTDPDIAGGYNGEVTVDHYGRRIPKHAHGTVNIGRHTSSARLILKNVLDLFDRIIDEKLLVRRINISANHVMTEELTNTNCEYEQLDLFTDYEALEREKKKEELVLKKERSIQQATIELRNRYGKNAVLKGSNLKDGATTRERNRQIGGHKA